MEELIKRALEKNQDAYSKIYEQTHNNVAFTIRVLLKDDAAVDDILQETYITAFQKLAMLKDPEKINAWICKIAKNKTIDYLRKNKEIAYLNEPIENEQGDLEEIDLPEDRVEFIPEKQMDKNENSRLLMDILNSLPQEQRVCVISFYYEQQSIKEIAEEVNCNEETVKSRIRYAKKKIKEQVEQLKKTGTHLYGVAPIPFFVWLLKDAGESYQYSGGVTGVQIATSSMASTLSANTATIEKAGSLGVKLRALSVGQKIAVGLVSTGVTVGAIGGGVVGYQHIKETGAQANVSQIEMESEANSEYDAIAVEVSQTTETEEAAPDYVTLLDQIDQLAPSDAVEVLRQYCENGTYGQREYLTVELENGAKKSSFCDEFGFLNAVLFARDVIPEDSYFDAQDWREPSEQLLELLEENNYMKGDCVEDVSEGSILVSNLENEDIAFYVNSIQDEAYELLYWDEGMLALEQDFPMDAMYRTSAQMEEMLLSGYTLYSYGKIDYSSIFWLELLEEEKIEKTSAFIRCNLYEKLVFDMRDYEKLKKEKVVEQNGITFRFVEEYNYDEGGFCFITIDEKYFEVEEGDGYTIEFDEMDQDGNAEIFDIALGQNVAKPMGEAVIKFDMESPATIEAMDAYFSFNVYEDREFTIGELLEAFDYEKETFNWSMLSLKKFEDSNVVAPIFDGNGEVISFEIVHYPTVNDSEEELREFLTRDVEDTVNRKTEESVHEKEILANEIVEQEISLENKYCIPASAYFNDEPDGSYVFIKSDTFDDVSENEILHLLGYLDEACPYYAKSVTYSYVNSKNEDRDWERHGKKGGYIVVTEGETVIDGKTIMYEYYSDGGSIRIASGFKFADKVQGENAVKYIECLAKIPLEKEPTDEIIMSVLENAWTGEFLYIYNDEIIDLDRIE